MASIVLPPLRQKFIDARRVPRHSVVMSARIITYGFNAAVYYSYVVDASHFGVKLETAVLTLLQETALVQFYDGVKHPVRKIWARGNQIGFAFTEPTKLAFLPPEAPWGDAIPALTLKSA